MRRFGCKCAYLIVHFSRDLLFRDILLRLTKRQKSINCVNAVLYNSVLVNILCNSNSKLCLIYLWLFYNPFFIFISNIFCSVRRTTLVPFLLWKKPNIEVNKSHKSKLNPRNCRSGLRNPSILFKFQSSITFKNAFTLRENVYRITDVIEFTRIHCNHGRAVLKSRCSLVALDARHLNWYKV